MKNFMGIRDLTASFGKSTTIRGANATGKTTIMNAFLWVLFNKNTDDRTDFNVKTLGPDGKAIPYLDHEVEMTLQIDDQVLVLRKVLSEKWTKAKGKADAEFSGNTATYYINGVPVTMREFNLKVETICPPNIFKLLTNPLYFPSMPWEQQRSKLFEMAGEVSDDDLALTPAMKAMLQHKGDKSVEWYNREITATKRKIKEELDAIPARIDEVNRNTPDRSNWSEIEKEIAWREEKLKKINEALVDKSKAMEAHAESIRGLQEEINKRKTRRQAIEFEVEYNASKDTKEAENAVRQAEDTIALKKSRQQGIIITQDDTAREMARLTKQREELIAEWKDINAVQFFMDESSIICPTCKRQLDDDDIMARRKDMEANFNTDKVKRLEINKGKGMAVAAEIQKLKDQQFANEGQASTLSAEIDKLTEQLPKLRAKVPQKKADPTTLLASHEEYNRVGAEIADLEKKIADTSPEKGEMLLEYETESAPLKREIEEFKSKLNDRTTIEKMDLRHKELKADQKRLSEELSQLEKKEALIHDYNKLRIEAIEQKVNGRFKLVRFKLFDNLINGTETETCVLTIEGVPYPDINHAGKIVGGMDVISAFSEHYNMYLPVWTDNAESANELPKMKSQQINLYVTTDEKLIIE